MMVLQFVLFVLPPFMGILRKHKIHLNMNDWQHYYFLLLISIDIVTISVS